MADPVVPFAQGQDAAAQAAIQANLTYRAVNNPETLTPAEQAYLSNKVVSPTQGIISQSQDAANEAAKQQAAFSQPRTDTREVTSPEGRAIIAQYAAQHPGWTEKPIQYEKSAAGIAAEVGLQGGTVGVDVAQRALSEGYTGPIALSRTPTGQIDYGISTVPTRDYSSGLYTDRTVLDNGQVVTAYAPIDRVTQVELLNSKILLGYNTGEIGIYQKPAGHSLYNLVSGGSRAAVQSGMFTVGKAQTPFVVNQWDIGTYTGQVGSKEYSRLGAEAYGGYVVPLDNRLLGTAQLSTYENILNLANYVNPQGVNLNKVEAPGADIPWAIGANSPAIQYVDNKGVVAGSGVVFSAIVPESAKVETTTKVTEISPGVFTTGEITYIGSSGRLPVVSGSYKSETINKPSEASLSNFATNLYGNVVNTLGGLVGFSPNLETTKGFAETTTKEEYQVSLPQAFVSQAPKAYVATPIIMDMRTVTTEKEASLYETYNVQLSSAIPKLPTEMTFAAARGEYNAIDSVAIGAYEKASTRPLDVIKYADIGALIVLGGGAIGEGVSALAAGTRAAPIVAAAGEAAPGFFGTLYGYSVAERSTEGFKDFSTASATRFGGIASTEAIPMLAGGVFAARPTIGYEALSAVERALPDIQQRPVAGTPITRAGPELLARKTASESIRTIDEIINEGTQFRRPVETGISTIAITPAPKLTNVAELGKITNIMERSGIISPELKVVDVSRAIDLSKYPSSREYIGEEYVPSAASLSSIRGSGYIARTFGYPAKSVSEIRASPLGAPADITARPFVYSPELSIPKGTEAMDISRALGERKAGTYPEGVFEGGRVASPEKMPKFKEESGIRYIRVDNPVTGGSKYIPDISPIPMDVLPGVGKIGGMEKMSPQDPFAGLAESMGVRIEPVATPKGLESSYSGSPLSEVVLQQIVNPDVRIATTGFKARGVDLQIAESELASRVRSPLQLTEELKILPSKTSFSKPISIETTQFELALRSAIESEKRSSKMEAPISKQKVSQSQRVAEETLGSSVADDAALRRIVGSSKQSENMSSQLSLAPSSVETEVKAISGSRVVDTREIEKTIMPSYSGTDKESISDTTRISSELRAIGSRDTTISTKEIKEIEREKPILLAPTTARPPTGTTTWDITTTPTKPNIPQITPPSPVPPPPIPVVLPIWNPGQGGYATGTKRYRRKVQIETAAYLPNFVEKESMKFFRAVGKGRIASASPTGKVTVTSYQKKSRRK